MTVYLREMNPHSLSRQWSRHEITCRKVTCLGAAAHIKPERRTRPGHQIPGRSFPQIKLTSDQAGSEAGSVPRHRTERPSLTTNRRRSTDYPREVLGYDLPNTHGLSKGNVPTTQ